LGDQQSHPDYACLISSAGADYFDPPGCKRQRAPIDRFTDSCEVVLLRGGELAADNDHLGIEQVDGDGDGFAEETACGPRKPNGVSFATAQEANRIVDRCYL
jgi:hypothetical protein